ncbi:hypothetical protein PBAL39_00742 [Pedobacter sp. BAL39]|uniref:suppressor of fused domain protein n=1 Tax=Pedobacter sp. BAL39 TaxID=391596 RepID=UPI0001559D95|nr:suppressor of fused domain protein [Pedobacter sp. BAL39]EDM38097.1 hypothetical protein PBAL39_00742 [Pedobacter sp. BAL39]
MTAEEYQNIYKEDDAVGWLAIDEVVDQLYKQEPRHYPPLCGLHYMAGGTDPIDGASVYDSEQQTFHRHIISYGMSELYYNPESTENEFSKWGFEFTMRIAPFEDDKTDPLWAVAVMNNLARYVLQSGKWFEPYHFVPANGPIRLDTDTDITGLVFVLDPELGKIATPHGEVSFLQMVGITSAEVERLKANPGIEETKKLIEELKKDNPLLITDLNRKG